MSALIGVLNNILIPSAQLAIFPMPSRLLRGRRDIFLFPSAPFDVYHLIPHLSMNLESSCHREIVVVAPFGIIISTSRDFKNFLGLN